MNIQLEPGRYIVAVSGGVDSVALLALLQQLPDLELVVAHFDHGMREESTDDQKFAAALADKYGLKYVYACGDLGENASEADARSARYTFLHEAMARFDARAIVTAHHQDDVLETAIINIKRGTGRRGLTSLRSTSEIERPLLAFSKVEIIEYAQQNQLEWREDRTNKETKYLRNYIRHKIITRIPADDKQRLLNIITSLRPINDAIDGAITGLLSTQKGDAFDKHWFQGFPDEVRRELLAAWLRERGIGFDQRTISRAVKAISEQRPGSSVPLKSDYYLRIERCTVVLTRLQR